MRENTAKTLILDFIKSELDGIAEVKINDNQTLIIIETHYSAPWLMTANVWMFNDHFSCDLRMFDATRKIHVYEEIILERDASVSEVDTIDLIRCTEHILAEYKKIEGFYRHHLKL